MIRGLNILLAQEITARRRPTSIAKAIVRFSKRDA